MVVREKMAAGECAPLLPADLVRGLGSVAMDDHRPIGLPVSDLAAGLHDAQAAYRRVMTSYIHPGFVVRKPSPPPCYLAKGWTPSW